ncbi:MULTISPECIES: trigger factor [unclassified Pseudodesulfovibrio]|uniref:trigger factor n=1 Tax=unclassified Pseudodesulfovibrio TaxID=2661612 RepID=UPI000FEBCD03|nr:MULTISPECIES: trigger factor [unclassified Pseudodesulfovibrio]MCJ2163642.1 trigger factor [Pseudodesulfovibrio sp. S3-i]RWU06095.1 trigger factor [Pseudodesulfovibrio sp. S3]
MEYNVEELSPVRRKITVEVPAEEANAAISAAIALYRMQADVKGFRKGKVPSTVVESKFRKQIYGEATTDLINYQINEIMSGLSMQPMSRIDVDAKELVRDEDFAYSIEFEVAPKLDMPNYKGLPVEEVDVVVSDAEVTEVESRILANNAEVKVIEDVRPPKTGEVASVSFGAYQGDKIVEGIQAENFDLVLGENQALPEFEAMIKTLTTGESGETDITFPADFINEKLAGQTVTMKAKLHAVKERITPKMSDSVAQKAGFKDVETMRTGIRESYASQRKQMNKSTAQSQLINSIIEGIEEFPLPPSMVEDRIDRLLQDLEYRLDRQGKGFQSLGKTPEELRSGFRAEAESTVKSEIFLLAVAAEEGLEISPEEIESTLTQMAMQTRQPLHELKKYYEDNNLIVPLKDRLLCDKASELIYDAAEVKLIAPPSEGKETPKKAAADAAPVDKGETKTFEDKAEAVEWAVTNLGIKESTAKSYSLAKLQERADAFWAEEK